MEEVLKLKKDINVLLVKEEKMWKQWSKDLWLHEGIKTHITSIVEQYKDFIETKSVSC